MEAQAEVSGPCIVSQLGDGQGDHLMGGLRLSELAETTIFGAVALRSMLCPR
eukprot:COSAG02_NODE_57869_length_279_cov_0.577778_1_plen_51_part_10